MLNTQFTMLIFSALSNSTRDLLVNKITPILAIIAGILALIFLVYAFLFSDIFSKGISSNWKFKTERGNNIFGIVFFIILCVLLFLLERNNKRIIFFGILVLGSFGLGALFNFLEKRKSVPAVTNFILRIVFLWIFFVIAIFILQYRSLLGLGVFFSSFLIWDFIRKERERKNKPPLQLSRLTRILISTAIALMAIAIH